MTKFKKSTGFLNKTRDPFYDRNSGFTLIEIIVVLIIVGILAAIALPNFYSNINKGKSQEAFAGFETYKLNLEACLNMHIGNEIVCKQGGSSPVALPSSNNMTYSYVGIGDAPVSTASNGTGISAATVKLTAKLSNGGATDLITLQRNSDGSYTPSCTGAFIGVC